MRLKTSKRLLNLASLVVFATAGAIAYWGLMPLSAIDADAPAGDAAPSVKLMTSGRGVANAKPVVATSASSVGGGLTLNWGRSLRRPLVDPPPPAPVVVVKPPPPPLRVKLLATVIESENSTAMLRLASGQVVFRKVGESLAPEDSNAAISKIEVGAISVRRSGEETRLSVEGTNGK